MIKGILVDGYGEGNKVAIDRFGSISVSVQTPDVPVEGTKNRERYYSAIMGTSGADAGTINANVNGSITNQEFYINAHIDYDIHINEISILIADSSATHNNFGAIAPLTNGIDIISLEHGDSTYIVKQAKTGGQVIAQSGFHYPFGDGATAWTLTKWTGTEDATVVIIPLHDFIDGGLRIGRGTQDKLSLWVRDDLTGLTEFTVRVMGYRLYP